MALILFYLNKKEKPRDFKNIVLKDKRIIKLFAMKDEGAYNIDTNSLIQEIEDLHLSRQFRNIRSDEFLQSAQRKLIDWTVEVVRNRSRCVSIKMHCFKVKKLLEQQLKDIRAYLKVVYRDELTAEYNTIKDKDTAIDEILAPFNKLLSKLDTVLTLCDILVEDLDKAHWSKESTISILNLNYGKAV